VSGNCTLRVLPIPSGPLGPSAQAVHDHLAPFGLSGESFSKDLPLVALNVPADADFLRIKTVLLQGEAEGWRQFEEACVTDAWKTA
jgi:hypothetical protein